jgi:hypothetical protein
MVWEMEESDDLNLSIPPCISSNGSNWVLCYTLYMGINS